MTKHYCRHVPECEIAKFPKDKGVHKLDSLSTHFRSDAFNLHRDI